MKWKLDINGQTRHWHIFRIRNTDLPQIEKHYFKTSLQLSKLYLKLEGFICAKLDYGLEKIIKYHKNKLIFELRIYADIVQNWTKIVIFSRGKVRRYPLFSFGDSLLEVVEDYTYLGTIFNYNELLTKCMLIFCCFDSITVRSLSTILGRFKFDYFTSSLFGTKQR